MKIFKYALFAILSLALFSSSVPAGFNRLQLGETIPEKHLSDISGSLKKYNRTIINFWNPNDPESRIRNIKYAQWAKHDLDINLLSICVSEDSDLASQILFIDGIAGDNIRTLINGQYDKNLLKDFQVNSGNRSFLVDSEGILISILP